MVVNLEERHGVDDGRAAIAAAAWPEAFARQRVVEANVEVKTADGACGAAFIHPATGSYPGVLMWPDAFGLRPYHARYG
jgi:carboxymethylenebutenolidase